jgi:cell division transport system permease protein
LAISSSYVLRETAGNVKRNLAMTLAAILTMTVSLTALGSVLVMRQAINKASVQSLGGVQVAIFLRPDVSTTETTAIRQQLTSAPDVKSFHFVDKPHAYAEFREIFGSNSVIVNALTVDDMPPSFRVVPTRAQDVSQLGVLFNNQPGVFKVAYPAQEVSDLVHKFNRWKWLFGVLAGAVLIGAVALIVNTIQLAIFARRREVAVMKLVGATNWFIRVPFMLEGFIQGMTGAIIACVLTYSIRNFVASLIPDQTIFGTNSLYVSPHEAILSGVVLLFGGAIVGVLGSAFAVRRYLAV